MNPVPPHDDTQSLGPDSDPRQVARRFAERDRAGDKPPEHIGPYRILETIGEGGMGVVYLAETKSIRRRVALKIIKLGLDTKEVIARFETEREALAVMNHPNVAKVFDAGATETGRPYFAMEYVAGIPITDYCDKHRLTTDERLRLFMGVCNAIQHAHQKGIIHRDIKPSNILVAVQDDKQVPKVIDFGVAKATQYRLTERTMVTEQGQLLGTPGYMSPEQAEMTALDIDTRSDVYSLGVVLYELLVGALPFEAKTLLQRGFSEIQRIIREVEPPKPSTRLSSLGPDSTSIAQKRRTEPRNLAQQIRGDLDWIVMKCLEKDRTRRYDTAQGLELEIQRFLNNEPVLAGPPSAAYRVKKFVRRNRAAVVAVSLIAALLILAISGTTAGMVWALRERERAQKAEELMGNSLEETQQARDESESVIEFLSEMLAAVDPHQHGKTVTVREVLDKSSETIGEKFADRPLIEARLRDTLSRTYLGLGLYDEAEAHAADAAALYRRWKGVRDPSTLRAMNTLAVAIGARGDFEKSEAQHRATLEIQRRVLGDEHPETLGSMNNLANALADQGCGAQAEVLYRKSWEIQRRVLGEEHPETLRSMNGLAYVLLAQGRYAPAEELHRKNLEIRARVLGAEHPETLRAQGGLANVLFNQGRFAQAEELNRKTWESRQRILGDEHPETMQAINNLAVTLCNQGRFTKAEELHRKNLEIRRRILGGEHPDTLQSINNLALALADQGRYRQAEEIYRQAFQIEERLLGAEHLYTLTSMQGLAEAQVNQGKPEEARPLRSKLIAARRKAVENGGATPAALHDLAESLLTWDPPELRDPGAALTLAERAVELTENKDPLFLNTLALAYHRTGAIDRAVEVQESALLLLPPERTPRRTLFEGRLGEYLVDQKNWPRAESLLVGAHQALREQEYAPQADRRESLDRLIKLYESWHAAEPDNGHDAKAGEYRMQLAQLVTP